MAIYGYIQLYIHVDLVGVVLFVPSRHGCSTLPPYVGAFSSHTPIGHYFLGTGLLKMFLWAVGSFCVFGEMWDLTLFLPSQIVFENREIAMLMVYLQRSIIMSLGKGSYFWEQGIYFLEKGVYFLRIPLWKYGGPDSANSANKVSCIVVQIMQIRWLDRVNYYYDNSVNQQCKQCQQCLSIV